MLPTFRLPVVAVKLTAAALLPTPTELDAPVVVIFCKVKPLAAVTLTRPEEVPVSVSAVVTISESAAAMTAPVSEIRLTLPP